MAQDDLRSLSSKELLEKRGLLLLVINPESESLTLGLGSQFAPTRVAQAIAHRRHGTGANRPGASNACASDAGSERASALRDAALSIKLNPDSEDLWGPKASAEGLQVQRGDRRPCWHTGGPNGNPPERVVGDSALRLPLDAPYDVVFPIVDGRFNLGPGRTHQHVRDDLCAIWSWAIENQLQIPKPHWCNYSVVLVVSEWLDGAEVQTLADVVLHDLGFRALVVHVEAVAATFGNGCSAACVVNIGTRTSRVCCVEDGVIIPQSRLCLPYGTGDVSDALLWVLTHRGGWPIENFDPSARASDRAALLGASRDGCFLPAEGPEALVKRQVHEQPPVLVEQPVGPDSVATYKVTLGPAGCIAPMGLFFPGLFGIDSSRLRPQRNWPSDFDEMFLERSTAEVGKAGTPIPSKAEPGQVTPGSSAPDDEGNADSPNADLEQALLPETQHSTRERAVQLPLDVAIVRSISSVPRPDLRRRLFASMLLVGDGINFRGLADMLERRVLVALPHDELTETVAVVEPKGDPRDAIWKGGVLLGVLEMGDHWVRREQWADGGVRVGMPVKFSKSENSASKVFWLFKAQQGG